MRGNVGNLSSFCLIKQCKYWRSLHTQRLLSMRVCVCIVCVWCVCTLRNGAFLAGAAAKLKSSLRHISSSRNTNSAGPSCTSSLTCTQQQSTLYIIYPLLWLYFFPQEVLFSYVMVNRAGRKRGLLTLLWSSVSSTDRDSRPHCKTFRTSMSNSLKYGQYKDRLTPALTSFSGGSCHNKEFNK